MKGIKVETYKGDFYRGKEYEESFRQFLIVKQQLIDRLIYKYGERRVKEWLKK